MKQKLIKWTTPILTACMALSWFPAFDFTSLILLGEYSYPTEKDM